MEGGGCRLGGWGQTCLQKALQPAGFSASLSLGLPESKRAVHSHRGLVLPSSSPVEMGTGVQEDISLWDSRGPEPCPELFHTIPRSKQKRGRQVYLLWGRGAWLVRQPEFSLLSLPSAS